MLWILLMNTILRRVRAIIDGIDLDRPVGTCDICGHRTYFAKGSYTEVVCIWCRIVAMLKLLLIPAKDHHKVQAKIETELKLKL